MRERIYEYQIFTNFIQAIFKNIQEKETFELIFQIKQKPNIKRNGNHMESKCAF